MRENNDEIPETVIHQIAALAKIPAPGQVLLLASCLRTAIKIASVQSSGLHAGKSGKITAVSSDRKVAKDILKLSRELAGRLRGASPHLRGLLTPPMIPTTNPTPPRPLEDLESAVADLHNQSKIACAFLSAHPKNWRVIRDIFFRNVSECAELCGGQLGLSKGVGGTLIGALELLKAYLPEEIAKGCAGRARDGYHAIEVSPDIVWFALHPGKRRKK